MTAITLADLKFLANTQNLPDTTVIIVTNHIGDEVKQSVEDVLSYDEDEDVITIQLAPINDEPKLDVKEVIVPEGAVLRVTYVSSPRANS